MENKTKNILIVALTVLIIGFLLYQQIAIGKLSKAIKEISKSSNSANQDDNSKGNQFMEKAVKSTIENGTKDFTGTIVSKGENSLNIEGSVVDLSKISNLSKDELEQSDKLPKNKKQFIVNVNEKTEMPVGLGTLKIGDNVHVFSEESVYGSGAVVASKVWLLPDSKALSSNTGNYFDTVENIGGAIKEIGNNYYVIEVQWIDYPKDGSAGNVDLASAPKIVKTYKVLINDKTVFSKKGRNDLKVGDDVNVYSDKPVFSLAEFTATKIEESVQPPKE
ncbi:MAG: hypothetical protein WC831_03490 [Parcubacteria group bacterium]|jgi:hypothetical protein